MTYKLCILPHNAPRPGPLIIDVTTRGGQFRPLSPMLLGPVELLSGDISLNVENGWQYSKVYEQHVDPDGSPSAAWWAWARAGWNKKYADRYPMGKGAVPFYSLGPGGEPLDYIDARRQIYLPLYAGAVRNHQAKLFAQLQSIADDAKRFQYPLTILDFDAYDHHALGMTLEDVLNDPTRKMGHGFVLAMMLAGLA